MLTPSPGIDLLESPLAVASVKTKDLRTRLPAQSCGSERSSRRTTHLAAFHDSIISSSATIGRSCPSFAPFLQTGHSCFEVMEFLIHYTFSVTTKFGSLGSDADSPVSRSSVHTTEKPAPCRTLCISYRLAKSRGVPAPFAGSQKGLQCLNPINSADYSSSTSSQKERRRTGAQRVRVTIVLV